MNLSIKITKAIKCFTFSLKVKHPKQKIPSRTLVHSSTIHMPLTNNNQDI